MLEIALTVALAMAVAVISFLLPEEFPLWVAPAVKGLTVVLLCAAAFTAGQLASSSGPSEISPSE